MEAVRQDFFSSVFLSNVKSILNVSPQAQLRAVVAQRHHPASVNRARSVHALKRHALEIFGSDLPLEEVSSELTQLMRATPNVERGATPGRAPTVLPAPFALALALRNKMHVLNALYLN